MTRLIAGLLLIIGLVWFVDVYAGPYVEVGVGINGLRDNNQWEDGNELGTNWGAGYMWHINQWTIDAGYQHYSQYGFVSEYESTLDAANLTLRYEWL